MIGARLPRRLVSAVLGLAGLLALVAVLVAPPGCARDGCARAGAAPALRRLGPVDPVRRLTVTLLLRIPGQRRLDAALAAIENPRSPRFHRFLRPATLGRRYGLAPARVRALITLLRARGLRTLGVDAERSSLTVTGTVGALSRLLGLQIARYADRAGHRFRLATGSVRPPAGPAAAIVGVTGIDTRPLWRAADVPLGGLTPAATAGAYDIAPLHRLGIEGQGQTIAVISFAGFDPSDPAAYAARHGLLAAAPR